MNTPIYAQKIKFLRLRNGLNINEGARHLGITRQYLSGLENGKYLLSRKMIQTICKAYGCTETYLTLDSVDIDDVSYSIENIIDDQPGFVEQLKSLTDMYANGYLTADEFARAKEKLING